MASALTLRAEGGAAADLEPPPAPRARILFFDPDQAVRLQSPVGRWENVPADDPAAVEAVAARLAADPCVYWHVNPVRRGAATATVADHVGWRWLVVEIDRAGDKTFAADDKERDGTRGLANDVTAYLAGLGWPAPVQVDSGNGWHCLRRLALPNDEPSRALVKFVLGVLADRFAGDDRGEVDPGLYNVTCGSKLPGTWARNRKQNPAAGRVHRMARIMSAPAEVEVVSADLLRDLARQASPELAAKLARGCDRQAVVDLLGYWPGKDAPPPRPALQLRAYDPGEGARRQAYSRRTVDNVCAEIAMAPQGQRERTLQRGAARLGQLVGAGDLDEMEAVNRLWVAACQVGLDSDPNCGERHVNDTIKRNIKWGCDNPRGVPDAEPHRNGDAWESPASKAANGPANGTAHADPAADPGGKQKRTAAPVEFPKPIPASKLKEGPAACWLFHGYLARGNITLFTALWKIGKTTLLAHMLKVMEAGGEFCGRSVEKARVLYVSEESETRWSKRRDSLGLKDHIEFVIQPFKTKPSWDHWYAFLDYLAAVQEQGKFDLIILDPLVNLWPVKDENDASQVISALMPLRKLPATAGVLLVHHSRKSDGQEATASRGSGGLTGFVDTIMELRRFDAASNTDRQRVITAYGRDEDTPREMVIELTDRDGYQAHGDREEVKTQALMEDIGPMLPDVPPGITAEKLYADWPEEEKPRRNTFFSAINKGVEEGRWHRLGEGRRGSPRTFWCPAGGELP